MSCDSWMEKLDAYLDGELNEADTRALENHLRECSSCTAQVLGKVQLKRVIQTAGSRFAPDPAFRARIQQNISRYPLAFSRRRWLLLYGASACLLAAALLSFGVLTRRPVNQSLLAELADLHVTTLASANPVDVVSTDRHTVKPWFAGKIPFTFNLPELQDTPFTLVGGKVAYLNQSPGAQLIFRVRQHQISVFIFQEKAVSSLRGADSTKNDRSFNLRTWTENSLRYFAISDVAGADLDKLADLLKSAG